MHMDEGGESASSVWILGVLFTGCGGADALLAESRALALGAAMSRALALQRASL